MKQSHSGQKTQRPIYLRLMALLLFLAVTVPALFTLFQMGFFAEEPVVEVQSTVTDPDAPTLRVATDYDFCPNSYINSDGQLSGLYIEIVSELANRLGVRLEFKTGEWLECRAMLENNDADILLGLEIFSNMAGTLRTIPICSDELRVYGRDPIDSAAALAGKRVALMARSVIETTYDLQCEYVEYYTNTDILQAVENGEVDYGICHAAVSSKIIEKNQFHLQPSLTIAKSYPALAVRDDRPDLKEDLNTILQEMSRDGTIGRLQEKWITNFTKNRSLTYVLEQNQLFYLTFLSAVTVLFFVCLSFSLIDKKRNEYISSLLDYQTQLKRSNEAAILANQTKSEFLSHMSHDIRTPINGILGMTEQIRRHEHEPTVIDECLDKISVATGHLLSLLNDVLDMSELERGKVRLESRPFDLTEELHSIELIVAQQASEQGITVEVHSKTLPHTKVCGSPLHLRRILLNLTSNAIKYNKPHGRVDLTAEELESGPDFARFRFTVQDSGIGMSQEFLEKRLYEPFAQENDNARTTYKGTGLGMSIVHELVTAMGGTISVQSRKGVGTTFTVELRFALDTAVDAAPAAEEAPAADLTGMRVLVAEDNDLNREIIQCLLEEAGVQVTMVENGQEAVDAFQNAPPGRFDAILMDIMMPVMDGIAAARAIRALPRPDAQSIPILAMTANAFEEDRKKTQEAGMNAHLTKPIHGPKLCAVLARYRKA